MMITDQFGLAYELLNMATGNRVIRVLSGRSVEELQWLQGQIGNWLGSEEVPESKNLLAD